MTAELYTLEQAEAQGALWAELLKSEKDGSAEGSTVWAISIGGMGSLGSDVAFISDESGHWEIVWCAMKALELGQWLVMWAEQKGDRDFYVSMVNAARDWLT